MIVGIAEIILGSGNKVSPKTTMTKIGSWLCQQVKQTPNKVNIYN